MTIKILIINYYFSIICNKNPSPKCFISLPFLPPFLSSLPPSPFHHQHTYLTHIAVALSLATLLVGPTTQFLVSLLTR